MDRASAVERLCRTGVIAIVRAKNSDQLIDVAKALLAGGVDCIEITMTTPNALAVIADCRKTLGDKAFIGVGSVLNAKVAREALAAGAQYVISPIFKKEVIDAAHEGGAPCIPGAFTPTEILAAWEAGADAAKVFPAEFFGPAYIKSIKGPFPHIDLLPTGGVTPETVGEYIRVGAFATAAGSSLVEAKALKDKNWAAITARAKAFVAAVAAVK